MLIFGKVIVGFSTLCLVIACGNSFSLEPEFDSNTSKVDTNNTGFFPIGVYYVRGQKTIQSDTDNPEDDDYVPLANDYRYNPEVAKREYSKEFNDLISYGFNSAILLIDPLVHPQAEDNQTRAEGVVKGLISAAEKASLKIVVSVSKTTTLLTTKDENLSYEDFQEALLDDYIDIFKKSDSILGYQIFDEPVPLDEGGNYGPFSKEVIETQLAEVKMAISEFDNDAFSLSTWNNLNSMELLNQGMQPEVLLMDLYPFALEDYNGDQAEGDTPFGDLSDAFPRGREDDGSFNNGEDQPSFSASILYAQTIAKDKPVWVALQAFGGASYWRKPLPNELKLQAFTAIKDGAKGIFYFVYQSENLIDGMMDSNYKETPMLIEAQEINEKINILAPTLLKLTKDTNHTSSVDVDVETFVHENGTKYLIIVNKDVNNSTTATISIEKSWLEDFDTAMDIYEDENFTITKENELIFPINSADMRMMLLGKK